MVCDVRTGDSRLSRKPDRTCFDSLERASAHNTTGSQAGTPRHFLYLERLCMKKEFLEAGKIVNTHGVRGELKLQPWADSAEFLRGFHTLYIDDRPYRVLASRVHKEMLMLRLEGVEDVNAAMCLKNKLVWICRADARLPEGHFFLQEIGRASCRERV